jgi:hypothetical protein
MDIDRPLCALQLRIDPLERFVHVFAESLGEPQLLHINGDRGFRYEKPDVRHFCLLKAARIVSALNACIELARRGYTQEIGTLMRTVAEFTSHIDFVLEPNDSGAHRTEIENYVRSFFADWRRDPAVAIKRAQLPQGSVHAAIGKTLDSFAEQCGDSPDRKPAATLLSYVYRTFSNYVHARYPEVMDLYGGRPGRFHLRGMSDTPKDLENVEIVATFIETASNTFIAIIQHLDLRGLIDSEPILASWYKERFEHPD